MPTGAGSGAGSALARGGKLSDDGDAVDQHSRGATPHRMSHRLNQSSPQNPSLGKNQRKLGPAAIPKKAQRLEQSLVLARKSEEETRMFAASTPNDPKSAPDSPPISIGRGVELDFGSDGAGGGVLGRCGCRGGCADVRGVVCKWC